MNTTQGNTSRELLTLRILPICLALVLPGCYYGSDAQYSQRQAQKRNEIATQGMREATKQTPRGTPLEGDALLRRLVERTWIKEYERFPNGAIGPYRTYDYYRQDGQFIRGHNWVYGEPVAVPGDSWRVEGPRLCVLHQAMSAQPACYTVTQDARLALQFYIDAPGTANHGLLTRVIERSEAGPPKLSANNNP